MPSDDPDRRDLLRYGALLAAVVLPACGDPKHAVPPPPPLTPAPPEAGVNSIPAPELEELTFAELAARLASGAETTRSLVTKYRARIAAIDRQGPMLRAVLELDPDADALAQQLDAERAAGKLRGPLHGLPILVKDNIDTGDKLTTTAGSLALEGTFAARDAFVIARLREAGALVLGKANLSEWANLRGTASVSGWSARGGQCRNPYALDRSPSGSSSGSAVATAANLCAGALGSETDGSIVSPASCNGLVGVKPTVGLVSRTGVVPISASQDTVGPLARSVTDAAILLTAIAGADPADPATVAAHPARPARPVDYAAGLDRRALTGARLGVPRAGFFGVNRRVDALIGDALAKLAGLGAILVEPAELEVPPELAAAELEVMLTELKAQLSAYLGARGADTHVRSLADVIAFNRDHAARELTWFGQEYFEQALAKGSLTDAAYLAARATCLRIGRDQLDHVMTAQKLDAFVGVTNSPAWMIDPVNGDGSTLSCSTLPAISGYPHVTVPAGFIQGLPVGLSFFGRPYSEAQLLGYAYAFEQATRHRKPPRYLPTVELVD